MKEFNLEEYNKMCAEFLEWEFQHGYYNPDHLHEYSFKTTEELKFHSDWNLIMEVVEKIKSINVYKNNPSDTTLATIREEIRIFLGLCNKKAAVQTIWEFLQLYKESHK
jgi:hypothetical protein